AARVSDAGVNDHTSAAPGQPFPQEHRQQEGRQVIDLKGQLMPVGCDGPCPGDETRVVDQDVDPRVVVQEGLGQPTHLGEVGEVAHVGAGADLSGGGAGGGGGA